VKISHADSVGYPEGNAAARVRSAKDHPSYGQGTAAEITAMVTISTADMLGLLFSTTHALSSGVAGTMMANRSGFNSGRSGIYSWQC
jgi:phosphate/sulfate permease